MMRYACVKFEKSFFFFLIFEIYQYSYFDSFLGYFGKNLGH